MDPFTRRTENLKANRRQALALRISAEKSRKMGNGRGLGMDERQMLESDEVGAFRFTGDRWICPFAGTDGVCVLGISIKRQENAGNDKCGQRRFGPQKRTSNVLDHLRNTDHPLSPAAAASGEYASLDWVVPDDEPAPPLKVNVLVARPKPKK